MKQRDKRKRQAKIKRGGTKKKEVARRRGGRTQRMSNTTTAANSDKIDYQCLYTERFNIVVL